MVKSSELLLSLLKLQLVVVGNRSSKLTTMIYKQQYKYALIVN
jgi:hypothetical protein